MKALHTKGGLWPPKGSCYLGGVRGCPPHRAKRVVVHIQGGAYTRRCTCKSVHSKVLHTKGSLWPPQESCHLGGVRGRPPHGAKRAVVHIQGGA